MTSILILDDEKRLLEELKEYMEAEGHQVIAAERPSEAFQALELTQVALALVDIRLPEYSGLEFIRRLRERYPTVEAIVMSGHGDMDTVIEALRLGAFDYLKKPFNTLELKTALTRTARYREARDQARLYEERCVQLNKDSAKDEDFIGSSEAMWKVRDAIQVAATNSDAPVIIYGESGTGKELVARRIHAASKRAASRFVAVNCSAIPRELFESEFFGHERGAFTDARKDREGLYRSAEGGTLFLDEVGELAPELQAKLLRVLENKTVRAVGSDRDIDVDARIVCATNRDLSALVREGGFRKDLYYRLAVIELRLPPLRERVEDIAALATHFLKRLGLLPGAIAGILDEACFATLKTYAFPGNIRELRNFMERVALRGKALTVDEWECWMEPEGSGSREIRHSTATASDAAQAFDTLTLSELEAQAIKKALALSGGVHTKAARLLGISRQALERRLEGIAEAK